MSFVFLIALSSFVRFADDGYIIASANSNISITTKVNLIEDHTNSSWVKLICYLPCVQYFFVLHPDDFHFKGLFSVGIVHHVELENILFHFHIGEMNDMFKFTRSGTFIGKHAAAGFQFISPVDVSDQKHNGKYPFKQKPAASNKSFKTTPN